MKVEVKREKHFHSNTWLTVPVAMGMGSSRPGEIPTENYNGLVLNEAVMQEPSDVRRRSH